jgi:4-amino-4-deoxy-L-arabinose transferase-like glycosyltransferase
MDTCHARDAALVVSLGIAVLSAAVVSDPPKLALSDEIIYALVGRNLATGRGNLTNIYDTHTVAMTKSVANPDYHMPLHIGLIALAFRVLGVSEVAALVPNYVGFLVSGFLLYVLGARHLSRGAGLVASWLFFTFPHLANYANGAMSEVTVISIVVVYLVVWAEALRAARPALAWLLGLTLALGGLSRETFLILLFPALWALTRWPPAVRTGGLLRFMLAFLPLLVGVFMPLYLVRPQYPNVPPWEFSRSFLHVLVANVGTNLSQFFLQPTELWEVAIAGSALPDGERHSLAYADPHPAPDRPRDGLGPGAAGGFSDAERARRRALGCVRGDVCVDGPFFRADAGGELRGRGGLLKVLDCTHRRRSSAASRCCL